MDKILCENNYLTGSERHDVGELEVKVTCDNFGV